MQRIVQSLVLPAALATLTLWQAAAQSPAATNSAGAGRSTLKETDLFPDAVVAKAKGFEIKRSQLDEEVRRYKSDLAARGQTFRAEENTALEQGILDQLIRVNLLESKATAAEKSEAKDRAEKRFATISSKLTSEELSREMKLMNTSREELVGKWAQLGAAESAAKRELKVDVSEADVKKFFDDNQAKFEQPELVVASHILLATRDLPTREELPADKKAAKHTQAQELLKRARAGENFAKLAKEYSEDPGSKDKGGEYEFPRGQMEPPFEKAAFSLNTNEVSEIVTTSYGYHIIKLSQKLPARQAGLNDEVVVFPSVGYFMAPGSYVALKDCWRDQEMATNAVKVASLIRQNLEGQRFQKELPKFLEQLKKEADLQILDDKLKPTAEPAAPAADLAKPIK